MSICMLRIFNITVISHIAISDRELAIANVTKYIMIRLWAATTSNIKSGAIDQLKVASSKGFI